jgi:hypothetical protein
MHEKLADSTINGLVVTTLVVIAGGKKPPMDKAVYGFIQAAYYAADNR